MCMCVLIHDFGVLATTLSTAMTKILNDIHLSSKTPSSLRTLDLSQSSDEIKKNGEPTKMGPLERVFLILLIFSSPSLFQVMMEKVSANEILWIFGLSRLTVPKISITTVSTRRH